VSLLLGPSLGFGLVTAAVLANRLGRLHHAVRGHRRAQNLAYGAVMILGAYLAYAVNQHGVSIGSAYVRALLGALISVLLNRGRLHAVPCAGASAPIDTSSPCPWG